MVNSRLEYGWAMVSDEEGQFMKRDNILCSTVPL